MFVNVKTAVAFINDHDPICAEIATDTMILVHFEEVDRNGNVTLASEILEVEDGLVDHEKVRAMLGY